MTNLAGNLLHSAAAHGDRPALRLRDRLITFRELERGSARMAGLLARRGVVAGDRVLVLLPNSPVFAETYYGILRIGAVAVPVNPLLKADEIRHAAQDSGCRLVLTGSGAAVEASSAARGLDIPCLDVSGDDFGGEWQEAEDGAGVVERGGDDLAVLLYTSGTSGRPKGARLTHANLRSNLETVVEALELGPDDVVFGGLPFFHVFGQTCGLNAAVRVGACVTLLPRFDAAEALDMLERHGVSVLQGVPTMYVGLLEAARARGRAVEARLRAAVSGGAAMPVEVLHRFEQRFGCLVAEGYGLSETSPVVTFNQAGPLYAPGSVGTPVPGVEVRLVDDAGRDVAEGAVGEIAVRGPNVTPGYWNRPEETAAAFTDGWFRTGDMARRDDAGRYYLIDRKKDLIIRGGYNVYPREVEEVLYGHPAVLEAVVVGVPDDVHGEEVAAAVTVVPGHTTTEDELRSFVKERIAAYKYPRLVRIADGLPKGPTGKILRRAVSVRR
ncbi:AMP-binding protein [Streptomyces parvulus]|uniref:long-chain-fatty-acid--CoA ligase n=1 Tax=Streptomyces parvulus TaxID=146923 RepID=UPI0036E741B3